VGQPRGFEDQMLAPSDFDVFVSLISVFHGFMV
jgi:hypothetical protein